MRWLRCKSVGQGMGAQYILKCWNQLGWWRWCVKTVWCLPGWAGMGVCKQALWWQLQQWLSYTNDTTALQSCSLPWLAGCCKPKMPKASHTGPVFKITKPWVPKCQAETQAFRPSQDCKSLLTSFLWALDCSKMDTHHQKLWSHTSWLLLRTRTQKKTFCHIPSRNLTPHQSKHPYHDITVIQTQGCGSWSRYLIAVVSTHLKLSVKAWQALYCQMPLVRCPLITWQQNSW